MRQFFARTYTLLAALVFTLSLCIAPIHASDNWTPTNVGIYNFSTFATSSSAYQLIAARNLSRNYLMLQNTGLSTINVKFGASTVVPSVQISAGTIWQPAPALVDSVYAESVTGAPTLVIIEGTK